MVEKFLSLKCQSLNDMIYFKTFPLFFQMCILLAVCVDRLDISIEIIYSKRAGKDIPMLSVIDDGHGMTHQEIVRMTCFGHKQPDADDLDRIGRFGVGFKVVFVIFLFVVSKHYPNVVDYGNLRDVCDFLLCLNLFV